MRSGLVRWWYQGGSDLVAEVAPSAFERHARHAAAAAAVSGGRCRYNSLAGRDIDHTGCRHRSAFWPSDSGDKPVMFESATLSLSWMMLESWHGRDGYDDGGSRWARFGLSLIDCHRQNCLSHTPSRERPGTKRTDTGQCARMLAFMSGPVLFALEAGGAAGNATSEAVLGASGWGHVLPSCSTQLIGGRWRYIRPGQRRFNRSMQSSHRLHQIHRCHPTGTGQKELRSD